MCTLNQMLPVLTDNTVPLVITELDSIRMGDSDRIGCVLVKSIIYVNIGSGLSRSGQLTSVLLNSRRGPCIRDVHPLTFIDIGVIVHSLACERVVSEKTFNNGSLPDFFLDCHFLFTF